MGIGCVGLFPRIVVDILSFIEDANQETKLKAAIKALLEARGINHEEEPSYQAYHLDSSSRSKRGLLSSKISSALLDYAALISINLLLQEGKYIVSEQNITDPFILTRVILSLVFTPSFFIVRIVKNSLESNVHSNRDKLKELYQESQIRYERYLLSEQTNTIISKISDKLQQSEQRLRHLASHANKPHRLDMPVSVTTVTRHETMAYPISQPDKNDSDVESAQSSEHMAEQTYPASRVTAELSQRSSPTLFTPQNRVLNAESEIDSSATSLGDNIKPSSPKIKRS